MNEWKTKALRLFDVKQELEAERDQLKAEVENLRYDIKNVLTYYNNHVAPNVDVMAERLQAALKEQEHE